jgi:hypothetical protein
MVHPNWAMSTMVGFLFYSFKIFLTMGAHYVHTLIFNKNPNIPKPFYATMHTYPSDNLQLKVHSLNFSLTSPLLPKNPLHIYIISLGISTSKRSYKVEKMSQNS